MMYTSKVIVAMMLMSLCGQGLPTLVIGDTSYTSLLLAGDAPEDSADNNFNTSESSSYSFEQYVQEFHKVYDSTEEYHRRQIIFQQNVQTIVNHNNKKKEDTTVTTTFQMGVNSFTDQLPHELPFGHDKSMHPAYNTININMDPSSEQLQVVRSKLQTVPLPEHLLEEDDNEDVPKKIHNLPQSVDWRHHTTLVTTPIKNQGGCGSCWAFAATAALESHIALRTNKLFTLSVQEFVSCVPNLQECGGGGGCSGSTAELAYDYVAKHGMVTEWDFGYQSYHGDVANCTILDQDYYYDDHHNNFDSGIGNSPLSTEVETARLLLRRGGRNLLGSNKPKRDGTIKGAVASIVGFANLPTNTYATMMKAVATVGPVVVNVAASSWGLYSSGVFDDDDQETREINHAVVLEGYGTDEETGQDYWLIRNSWGPKWGEDGYIRLKRVDPSTLDDPDAICKMDNKPADGIACTKDDNGESIVPPPVKVCGCSGVLFDGVIPVGGHLL